MMRHLLRASPILVGALLLVPASGQAQLTYVGTPLCSAWSQLDGGWVQCAGNFDGNDNGASLPGVVSWISSNWGLDVSFAGSTDPEDEGGVFTGNQFSEGATEGTLQFAQGVSGIFVLSLKTATHFSLYQFDTGGEVWTSLNYSTAGVSLNKNGGLQDLSHSLYLRGSTPVPEPASMALLLTGLVGMGLIARRRKVDADV